MIDLPEIPDIASYRFRLRDEEAQRRFAPPPHLANHRIVSFYLRQAPSDRAPYECGHALSVDICDDAVLKFNLYGLADWEHGGRLHDFVQPISDVAARLFGTPNTTRCHSFNELDRFTIHDVRQDLSHLIEQYVRDLAPHFPITRGAVSYLRPTRSRADRLRR